MGFWPFGGGKKSRPSTIEEKYPELGRDSSTPDTMARGEKQGYGPAERPSRTNSRREPSERSKKLAKIPAGVVVTRKQPVKTTGEPSSRAMTEGFGNSAAHSRVSSRQAGVYQQNVQSNSSLGPESFYASRPTPTLKAKRSDYNPILPRRKSSKRKAEDHAREREVRAMSSPIPIPKRPVTYSEGLLSRETRKMPGDLNRNFERPTSEISLPLPESFSEMDSISNQNSFKVSPFAVLSPRPTIRYDKNPRTGPSQRQVHSRLSVHQALVEEDLSSSRKRIDNLADNLDSGGLRELMERDRKRRERKREDDKSKLQRKLQRRADRQKEEEEEARAAAGIDPSTPSRHQREEDHDLIMSSNFPSSPPTVDTEMQDATPRSRESKQKMSGDSDPFADPKIHDKENQGPIRNPFEDEKEPEEADDPFAHQNVPEPTLPVRSPLRDSLRGRQSRLLQKTMSPPTSPQHEPVNSTLASQATTLSRETPVDVPESSQLERRGSDSAQPVSVWTNFFRRGNRRKPSFTDRGSTGPSEFTNTSRESFSRQPPPPIIPPRSYRRSGTPQRTLSKFREDLPELPISPPDSRVQSPEFETANQAATLPFAASIRQSQSISGTSDARSLATSSSMPTLDRGRPEKSISQQRSVELQSPDADLSGPGPALSQSLASVDSEASWLSGRPNANKRGSAQMGHPLRQSQASLRPQGFGAFGDDEGDGVADDEFMNRLSPAPEDSRRSSSGSARRKASSTVIDLRKEQDPSNQPEVPPLPDMKDEKWHSSLGRQPTLVKQPSHAKSKEGLLKEYDADEQDSDEDASPDVETSGMEFQESPIMRAKSVEYGKGHSRVISAGSARLLDIRRSSVHSEKKLNTALPATDATQAEEKAPAEK